MCAGGAEWGVWASWMGVGVEERLWEWEWEWEARPDDNQHDNTTNDERTNDTTNLDEAAP